MALNLLPFIVTFADGSRFALQASAEGQAVLRATDLWRDYNGWYAPVPAVTSVEQRLR